MSKLSDARWISSHTAERSKVDPQIKPISIRSAYNILRGQTEGYSEETIDVVLTLKKYCVSNLTPYDVEPAMEYVLNAAYEFALRDKSFKTSEDRNNMLIWINDYSIKRNHTKKVIKESENKKLTIISEVQEVTN